MRPTLSRESLLQLENAFRAEEDAPPDTVPCPHFQNRLAAASTVCEEGEDLLNLVWGWDSLPFSQ